MTTLPAVKRFDSSNGVRIYRIPCQVFEDLTARVYLLLGAGPPTLVDTGSGQGESTGHVLAGLDAVRDDFGEPVRPNDIRRILITHGHVDHVGGLPELLRVTGAEVGIHPLDSRALTAPEERAVVGRRRMLSFLHRAGVDPHRRTKLVGTVGYRRDERDQLPVDLLLDDRMELDGLRLVHTPGHSPGHVCIVAGNLLLSADHILARTIPQLWPESMIPHAGLDHYLDSLDKIRRIDGLEAALAGHEPVVRDVYKRIETIRASHLRRLDRLTDVLKDADRPLSIAEISRRMYASRKGFYVVLALTDVAARVEYLHQRGLVAVGNLDEVEAEENAVFRYCAV